MRAHDPSRFLAVGGLAAALFAAFALARAGTDGVTAASVGAQSGPVQADEFVTMNVMPSAHLPVWQEGSGVPHQADITRPVTENWEDADVFDRNSLWRTFDPFVSQPSLNDQIKWGRRDCEATVGRWGIWSVGGGSVGAGYACRQNYPSPLPNRPSQGIRTELQYLYLDLTLVPPEGGLRITFDYKSRMPPEALFVGAGDFDNRNPDGSIPIRGRNDFQTDTQGDWVRGHRVEVRDGNDFKITGKSRVLFAMVYSDPPASGGAGVPSSDSYGVYVDNVHLDAMFVANPGIIPSHTVPVPDTPTHTPEPSPTPTGIEFNTPVPTRHVAVRLPAALNRAEPMQRTPVPTAPTATITPTPEPATATPTATLPPSATPTITPVPSPTPIPHPDVRFDFVAPLDDPEVVRVRNFGTLEQLMDNWRVFAFKRAESCFLPQGLVLGPDEHHDITSGRNAEPGEDITICNDSRLIWDNNLDEAQLWDHRNEKVDSWCYDRFGPVPCEE